MSETLHAIRALHEQGRFEDSYALIDQTLAGQVDRGLQRDIALFLFKKAVFHKFSTAVDLLDAYLPDNRKDFEAHVAHAYMGWVGGRTTDCIASCARAIGLRHNHVMPYRILGLYYLNRQEYLPAYTSLAAGMLFCAEKGYLQPLLLLASAMLKELPSISFQFDGFPFTFNLTCFNAMAVESSTNHLQSQLCEADELRLIRSEAIGCSRILECGCLVGNHTLYFAKTLRPEKIILIDANQQCLDQTQLNFTLNADVADITLDLRHRAVSTEPGMIELLGNRVQSVVLDDEIQEPVDFMKIDVDGVEMVALEGLRRTIGQYRPKIMIEVSNEFSAQFREFVREIKYEIRREIVRGGDGNYLISPSEGWRPLARSM